MRLSLISLVVFPFVGSAQAGGADTCTVHLFYVGCSQNAVSTFNGYDSMCMYAYKNYYMNTSNQWYTFECDENDKHQYCKLMIDYPVDNVKGITQSKCNGTPDYYFDCGRRYILNRQTWVMCPTDDETDNMNPTCSTSRRNLRALPSI